jgi:signal transduction histidine kinase
MSRTDGRLVWMKRVSVRLGESSFDLVPLIAHDLRTPITAIKGLSQLALRRPDLPDSTAHYLSAVVEEANQIATLVDDLVLVRRLERGEVTAFRSRVDLNGLVRTIRDNPPTPDASLRPTLSLTADPVVAECDPHILSRAILLLLVVTSRQARSNERLTLGTCRSTAGAELWIVAVNNSTGATTLNGGTSSIVAAELTDQSETGGSIGHNLSVFLATKLVEALGGQVLFDDAPGHGARFHVVLPEARGS